MHKFKTLHLKFSNETGHELAARLEMPEKEPVAFGIFAHCFACSKDTLAATRISRALTKENFAVLRFDFTGLGHSTGDFSDTTFSSNIMDIVYAAKYLRDHYQPPRLLIGHSLGGAAVIAASPLIPEVTALATIGAPSNPAHVSRLFEEHLETLKEKGEVTLTIASRELNFKQSFLEDIKEHNLEGILENQNKAIMIFHSPLDTTVNIEHAGILYKAARHPKSFISLDQADHLLTAKQDADFVAAVLAAWTRRYLGRQA